MRNIRIRTLVVYSHAPANHVRLEPQLAKLGLATPADNRPSSRQTLTARTSNHNRLATIQSNESSITPSDPTSVWALPTDLPPLSIYLIITISMCCTREQITPRRKRRYTEACLPLDDLSESQPSKRLKSSKADFYDSLSKVWLTRRALKELARRTRQADSPQRTPSAPRPVSRPSTLKQIQRFARHGGPDLRDLRGVRLNCPRCRLFLINIIVSSSSRGRTYTRDGLQKILPKQALSIYCAND